jgi:hypothetical protein
LIDWWCLTSFLTRNGYIYDGQFYWRSGRSEDQSINLPDALIEKCFGQNFVHVQLSQIIFMKNSQPRHFVSKNKSP